MKPIRYGAAPVLDLEGSLETLPLQPEPLAEITRVPMWAIGAVAHNSGRRHQKLREKVWQSAVNVGGYNPTGAWGPHGPHSPTKNWSEVDWDPSTERSIRKHKNIEPRKAAWKGPPPGNLKEDEYRFWMGYPVENASESTCRWCAASAWSREQREAHFRIGRMCNNKMLVVSKFALKHKTPICMVCAKTTWQKRWGVPLCNTVECIGKWKFGKMRFFLGWEQMRQEAAKTGHLDTFELTPSGI